MNRKALSYFLPARFIALALPLIAAWPQRAQAASGTWNVNAAGNWSLGSNWSPNAVPGTAAGDTINLTFNITAARTVTIDTTSRTVGDLNIGDPTATLFGYTLAASGGAVLNLDGSGSADATVDFLTAIGNTVSTPITLVDNGVFRSNVNSVQTFSGIISGAGKTLTFNNDTNGTVNAAGATLGQFNVSGANTYSGGTSISDVRVQASNASALGTGAVTIASGGQVYGNAAITLANNFTINGSGWAETAAGNPFGALRLDNGTIVSGSVTMQSASAIGSNVGTGTVNGVISGGFALQKRGAGTLVLTNANTYSGTTDIAGGVLRLNNAQAAGTASNITWTNGGSGRLQVNGGVSIGYNLDIAAGQAGAVGAGLVQQSGTGQAIINGTITLAAQPAAGGVFVGGAAAGNELVLNGAINGGSTIGFSQRDGRVTYNGGGTIGGLTPITGTALIGANNGMPVLTVPNMGASGAATLDVQTFSQELGGLARVANTTTVTGAAGSALTLNVASGGLYVYDGAVSGAVSINKTGAGVQKLSGTSTTTTGTVSANGGTLIATNGAALGTTLAGLNVGSTGNFSYQPTAAGALNLGAAPLNFANGATIGGALGGTASQSAVSTTGAATTAGNVTVDVWMIPGVAPTAGSNDLYTAASGLDTATYSLGKVYNVTDFTVSGLTASPTAVSLNVNAATPLSTAYWRGGLTGAANVWAASDGSTQSNWVDTPGGGNQALTPGAGADVVISDSTVTTSPAPSVLGAHMSIKSLAVNDTVNGLVLNADTHSLTIGTGGITVASGVPASSIAAPVVLGAAQTWTNNSANPLTVSGAVSGANLLTKDGSGTLALTAANSNTGGVALNNGTLVLGTNSALGAAAGDFTINGGSIDSALANLSMGNAKPTVINGDFTYVGTGGNSLNLSTGAVSLGTAAGTSRSIAVNAGTLTLGGIISDGTTASGITKTGNGTLVLNGANTNSGPVSIGGGTVQIAATTGIGNSAATNTLALSGGGRLLTTAAVDLGANRSIAVGTGGGVLAQNASGTTLTIPGNITGSGALTLRTVFGTTNTNNTFLLSGNNSGYTGAITLDAPAQAGAILNVSTVAALPAASSITLNYPALSTTGGAAATLNLPIGVTVPATTQINFTSLQATPTLSLRSGMTFAGAATVASPMTFSGSSVVQFNAAAATTVDYTGSITEATPGAFAEGVSTPYSNVLFYRGAGTHNVTGNINLPSAGSTIAVTDGATLVLNSTGNSFASANPVFGTLRLGAAGAIPSTARLLISQAGDQNPAQLDLNGFDQTVAGLEWAGVNINIAKGITNTSTTAATFTVNQATAPGTAIWRGSLAGNMNFVKDGAATVTLGSGISTATGNIEIKGGTLVSSVAAGDAAGSTSTLGAVNLAGKTITVGNGGTWSLPINNVLGNGVANANLPTTIINAGGTVTATRYNVLGNVQLNGGTLTQSSTDTVAFEGYQLRGDVTVGGSAASTISTGNGKGTHLGANTLFTVANATGDSAADLIVSTPLLNQSGDFSSAAGGFTKDGAGTMTIASGVTSSFTGPVTVAAGVLNVNGNIASSSGITMTGGTLTGGGTTPAVTFGPNTVLSPGNSPGQLSTGNVSASSSTDVLIELGGLTAITEYDRINTLGTLALNDSVLTLSLINGFAPANGDIFDIWLNDGTDAIGGTGQFAGLPEGAAIVAGSGFFTISYLANADAGTVGNDIRLTFVPEPGSSLCLLLAGGSLLARRRRVR